MAFRPEEILFSPTADCNLSCPHCVRIPSGTDLPNEYALRFLSSCKRSGINRVGFTGGEPFLAMGFLVATVKRACKEGLLFSRIMTNGVWFSDVVSLKRALNNLRDAGYDGDICVSVDAFHSQSISKLVQFIRAVLATWNRRDMISLAYVSDGKNSGTESMLRAVSSRLGANFSGLRTKYPFMRSRRLFIKIFNIELSYYDAASSFEGTKGRRWFIEDRCEGPGNVLAVMPDGDVKPCCGYAQDLEGLTIGNIKRDTINKIIRGATRNRFVRTVFNSGLSVLRQRLIKRGVKFPGRTASHCSFCRYLLTVVPKRELNASLDR